MRKIILLIFILALTAEASPKLICKEDPVVNKYCSKLEQSFYKKRDDLENILYMTDNIEYLKRDPSIRSKEDRKFEKKLQKKVYEVMYDINSLVKKVTNEVRKQKYRAMGMVVQPLKYGSNQKLKYRDFNEMIRGRLKKDIKTFFSTYQEFGDEFLTDVLRINSSAFIVFPEIVQYDEFKADLVQNKTAELQIAISGFFGLEKGMSEAIVMLGVKLDENGKLRRAATRKEEYELLKKALVELMDKALSDIASQEE